MARCGHLDNVCLRYDKINTLGSGNMPVILLTKLKYWALNEIYTIVINFEIYFHDRNVLKFQKWITAIWYEDISGKDASEKTQYQCIIGLSTNYYRNRCRISIAVFSWSWGSLHLEKRSLYIHIDITTYRPKWHPRGRGRWYNAVGNCNIIL